MDLKEATNRISAQAELVTRIREEVAKVIVGQEKLIDRLVLAMVTGGHILLEGVPGLAKTLSVNTLAKALGLDFKRISFTPDLLPADVVGTLVYSPKTGEFSPKKGPVFTNLLLADEINRAPAKVQSALLESMQERQVTIGEETYRLPEPFLVLATQNPIEQEGTYPLPEAQLDRFLFNITVDYPKREDEIGIYRAETGAADVKLEKILDAEEILKLQEVVRRVPVADHVLEYAADLVRATRPKEPSAPEFIKEMVAWGAGPRAGLSLILAAKARAILEGRPYVITKDVKAMALPVMRHRISTTFNAEAAGVTADSIVTRLVDEIKGHEELDV